jgi:hypothetical protein
VLAQCQDGFNLPPAETSAPPAAVAESGSGRLRGLLRDRGLPVVFVLAWTGSDGDAGAARRNYVSG